MGLERAFLRSFFEQLESFDADTLDQKIAQVERVQRACSKGSEAYLDARFMLKHMRQRRLELILPPRESKRS